MKAKLLKFLQIALPLGLGIYLIWYVYRSFTPEQIEETKHYFSKANYSFILLSVTLSILSHLSRAYRWNFILEPMGYRPRLMNNFLALSVGYLFNIFIPRSGEISRAVILDKYENVPFQKGFGTIISERVVDLLFLLFFTALAVFLHFEKLYGFILESLPISLLRKLVFGIVVLASLLILFIFFSKSRINKKIKDFVLGLKEGLLSILYMKRKGAFLFQSLLIWILYVLSFYAAFLALADTAEASFGTIIIAFVVGSFTLTFTHNGFGSYPVAMAGILSVFGIFKTVGIALGWIIWTSSMLSLIVIGVAALLFLPVYNKRH